MCVAVDGDGGEEVMPGSNEGGDVAYFECLFEITVKIASDCVDKTRKQGAIMQKPGSRVVENKPVAVSKPCVVGNFR